MQLTSTAFKDKDNIPKRHTCQGGDISPQLAWENVPAGTKSLALIMEDPDAKGQTFIHWVAWNIDPQAEELKEGMTPETPHSIFMQGTNSLEKLGYLGPCPPTGSHRYFFRLYALNKELDLLSSTTKEGLLEAIKGHILGKAELMGRYQKS